MKTLRGGCSGSFQTFSVEINAFVAKQKILGKSKNAKINFIPFAEYKEG